MKYPEKPERQHIRAPTRTCRNCDAMLGKALAEIEDTGQVIRKDEWCPVCNEYLGTTYPFGGTIPGQINENLPEPEE